MKKIMENIKALKEFLVERGYDDLEMELNDLEKEVIDRYSYDVAVGSNANSVVVIDGNVVCLASETNPIKFNNYDVDFNAPIVINSDKAQGDAIELGYALLRKIYVDEQSIVTKLSENDDDKDETVETEEVEDMKEDIKSVEAKDEIEEAEIIEEKDKMEVPEVKDVNPFKVKVEVKESKGVTDLGDGVIIENKFKNNITPDSVDISKAEKKSVSVKDILSGDFLKKGKDEGVKGISLVFNKDGLKGNVIKEGGAVKLKINRSLKKEPELNITKPSEDRQIGAGTNGEYYYVLNASNELIPITEDESRSIPQPVIVITKDGYIDSINADDVDETVLKVAIKKSTHNMSNLDEEKLNGLLEYANE